MTKEEKDSAKSYLERCDKAWSELHDDMEYRWWQNGVYDHELCCVRNVMERRLFPLVRMVGWRIYDLAFGLGVSDCDVDAPIPVLGFEHDFWSLDHDYRGRESFCTTGLERDFRSPGKSSVRELAARIARYLEILAEEIRLADEYTLCYFPKDGSEFRIANFIMLRLNSVDAALVSKMLVDRIEEVGRDGWDAIIAARSPERGFVAYDANDKSLEPVDLRKFLKALHERIRWILNDIANCLDAITDQIVKELKARRA
jgi:hypothetical protein